MRAVNGRMFDSPPQDRRRFLRIAITFSTGALLAGCGGGGGGASDAVTVVSGPAAVSPTPTPAPAASGHSLGLALNLAYLGAQFYGIAARGIGLAANLTTGAGIAGSASGARQIVFADALVAAIAIELADDKQAQVLALRTQIGAQVPAQPTLDLSTGSRGAFSLAAQGAGLVASGTTFDPYASDENFLLGAFLIENAVAAAYRTTLSRETDPATIDMIAGELGNAIYHGGLIRTLLDAKTAANPALDTTTMKLTTMLATLDGTNIGDQTLASASGPSSNLFDADRRPIPFTRANDQVLRTLYLSNGGVGGFLPNGANGVMA